MSKLIDNMAYDSFLQIFHTSMSHNVHDDNIARKEQNINIFEAALYSSDWNDFNK